MSQGPPDLAMPYVSDRFGYYPIALDVSTSRFTIRTLPDHAQTVADIQRSPYVRDGWIYPGAQRQQDLMTGLVSEMPYCSRVFGMPKTHELRLHASQDSSDLEFVVWCLSFLAGMRLTTTEAGFLDATPVKPGELVDFCLVGCTLEHGVELALNYLASERGNPRAAKRVCAIIHALFMAQFPQSLPFEQFQYLYMALDACFRLAASKERKEPRVAHFKRIRWTCDKFGLPVPAWADDATRGKDFAAVRNDAIHEALFFNEPLGFAIDCCRPPALNADRLLLQMQALVCRLLVAILGKPAVCYVHSAVDTRQTHALELR
jgi:hypothetical protein